MADAAQEPTLTDSELTELLTEWRRATVWAASTAYAVGDSVVPTAVNGRRYRCEVAGSSQATEPSWGTLTSWHVIGRQVSDGTTLVWVDQGPAFVELWDLGGAAGAAWGLKASKAAAQYDFSSNGQTFSRSQLIAHCLMMQTYYQGLVLA